MFRFVFTKPVIYFREEISDFPLCCGLSFFPTEIENYFNRFRIGHSTKLKQILRPQGRASYYYFYIKNQPDAPMYQIYFILE